jgi:hypothetical protein
MTTFHGAAFAQTSSGSNTPPSVQETRKINNIKQLLTITGASSLSQQVVTQLLMSMKAQYPQVPQKFWDAFLNQFKPDDLVNELIPIYSKYYSNEDINQLIAFYQTPLGKKTIAVLPQLTQESIITGQRYGLEISKKVLQQLEAEGYLSPQQKSIP